MTAVLPARASGVRTRSSASNAFGDQQVGLHRREKVVGADEVVSLAAAEEEADRIAERIDHGMDLGAQPSARAPDRLVRAPFLGAPALC